MCDQVKCPAKRSLMVKPESEAKWYGQPTKRVMLLREPHIVGWLYGENLDGDAVVQWDDDVLLLLPVSMADLVIL